MGGSDHRSFSFSLTSCAQLVKQYSAFSRGSRSLKVKSMRLVRWWIEPFRRRRWICLRERQDIDECLVVVQQTRPQKRGSLLRPRWLLLPWSQSQLRKSNEALKEDTTGVLTLRRTHSDEPRSRLPLQRLFLITFVYSIMHEFTSGYGYSHSIKSPVMWHPLIITGLVSLQGDSKDPRIWPYNIEWSHRISDYWALICEYFGQVLTFWLRDMDILHHEQLESHGRSWILAPVDRRRNVAFIRALLRADSRSYSQETLSFEVIN